MILSFPFFISAEFFKHHNKSHKHHKLVPYSDSEDGAAVDDDVEIISSLPPSTTPRKRRRRMLREPLDVQFLRRSSRLAQDQGFLNDASASQALDNPLQYAARQVGSGAPAPHLPLDNIQGIATGFLQIQPGAVSAAALLELDDDQE